MPTQDNQPLEGFISANPDIHVDEIMASIQERIREKKESGVLKQTEIDDIMDMELLPLPDFLEVPNVYENTLYPEIPKPQRPPRKEFHPREITFENEEGHGFRGLIKKFLVKFRKLTFPFVRFMTRPIYNELKQLTLDGFNHNAHDIHNSQYEIECVPPEILFNRHIIFQCKDYIKLLHNATNNLIVELSKAKIEQELLKTKIKVLEDKVEFLENRERAIEKKVFPPPTPAPKQDETTTSPPPKKKRSASPTTEPIPQ